MILSVLAKSMLFLGLRLRRSTVCPTVKLQKAMRNSVRSAVPVRKDATDWTMGVKPPSVPTDVERVPRWTRRGARSVRLRR